MNKLLLIGIALLSTFSVYAQVSNGNVNMQVKFVQGFGTINNDGCCGGDPEQTWISRAVNDTDYANTELFSHEPGAGNSPNFC